MARWQGLGAFVLGSRKYKAGTTYADTTGNAIAGDVVYAPFGTSGGISPMLVPLDGAATALRNASAYATHNLPCTITGVNSIDG
jgi:hypothetical protein